MRCTFTSPAHLHTADNLSNHNGQSDLGMQEPGLWKILLLPLTTATHSVHGLPQSRAKAPPAGMMAV